jgi:hypothetical protein
MVDYSIATSSVPIGGRAVANINSFDAEILSDVDSVKVDWRDQNGLLLETLTRTTVDVSGTDIYGNASTLTDPTGTGNYFASLVVDLNNYSPPTTGFRWSLTVTVIKGAKTYTAVFYFLVVPTTLSLSLDSTTITNAVMRQAGILVEHQYVANAALTVIPLANGIVYAIAAAYKNGTPMAISTDYAWSTYRSNVTLVVASAVNDHFTFSLQKRSTDFVADFITRATQEVLRSLRPYYSDDTLTQSTSVAEILKSLAIGELKMATSQGTTEDSAFWRTGRDQAREARSQILRIQRGSEGIYDSQGNSMTRRDGTVIGGRLHPDGPYVNRVGITDRAQQHTGLFLTIAHDPIIAQSRATRGYTS